MIDVASVSFIGSGRVATHLSTALKERGARIDYIYSRNPENAEKLASKIGAKATKDLADTTESDVVIIAISDDAIGEVAARLPEGKNCIVAHTGGGVHIDVLPSHLRRAVFYPLQSFTFDKAVAWRNVPFCIEADENEDVNTLGELAELVSTKIHVLTSEQRKQLHLAAVFANNFANLMFEYAEEILQAADISRDILQPLMLETASKMLLQSAKKSQTGPASRGDVDTIKTHEELLADNQELLDIYKTLTGKIYRRAHGTEL